MDAALIKAIVDLVRCGGSAKQESALAALCEAAHRYHTATSATTKMQHKAELVLTAVLLTNALKLNADRSM